MAKSSAPVTDASNSWRDGNPILLVLFSAERFPLQIGHSKQFLRFIRRVPSLGPKHVPGVGIEGSRSQLMESSIFLFLLWFQGGTSPLSGLLSSSMVIFFQVPGCFVPPLGTLSLRRHSSHPHLLIHSAPSPLPIRAWNSRGLWEKQILPTYRKKKSVF